MRDSIQKHLDEIKIVLLSHNYDDLTMKWIVLDHIYAIQKILEKE